MEPSYHEFKFRGIFGISDIIRGGLFVINPIFFLRKKEIEEKKDTFGMAGNEKWSGTALVSASNLFAFCFIFFKKKEI